MKLKYSSNFYLVIRKNKQAGKGTNKISQIRFSFTYDGKRLEYYTGYRIENKKWDKDAQEVMKNSFNMDGTSASEINTHLNKIRSAAEEIYQEFKVQKTSPDISLFREELKSRLGEPDKKKNCGKSIFDYFDMYIENKKNDFSPGFHSLMKSTRNHLERFVGDRKITFEELNISFLEKFKDYYLVKLGNTKNSFAGALKRIKFFLNYALKNEWTTNTKFKEYSFAEEYGKPIFLNWDELVQLYKTTFKDTLLSQIKDIFVFQSLIGCRYDNLCNLKKEDIYGNMLSYIPSKDGPEISIPLNDIAIAIIKKYKKSKTEYLLPAISLQKYNEHLRIVGEQAGIKRPINITDKAGKKIKVPLFKLMTSHMARRNFIGNAINKFNIRTEIIQSFTGHVKNSKSFARYYEIDEEAKRKAIDLMKM